MILNNSLMVSLLSLSVLTQRLEGLLWSVAKTAAPEGWHLSLSQFEAIPCPFNCQTYLSPTMDCLKCDSF